jgi:hypothetical protein
MEELKKAAQLSVDGQMSQMMDQVRKSFSGVPAEYLNELTAAGEEFARKVSSAWDSGEAAKVYSAALADVLPEKELRASIQHYRTPEGQQELKAMNEAAFKLNAYILNSTQQAYEAGMREFVSRVRSISEKTRRDRETEKSK